MYFQKDIRLIKRLVLQLQEKYNPHHDHLGRFSTAGEAHLIVARDGTRTPGPKNPLHPNNLVPKILQKLKPPQAIIDKYNNNKATVFAFKAAKAGMSVEDYTKALDQKAVDLFKDAQPWIRVRPQILGKVLTDGRFKSQHETGKSGGLLDVWHRASVEEDLFGYDQMKTEDEDRPIYGYLSADGDGRLKSADPTKAGWGDTVDMYGSVSVRLKESIKDNTTWTGNDSLSSAGYLLPSALSKPDHTGFAALKYDSPLKYASLAEVPTYPEAQYHGGVNTSHIAEVVFENGSDIKPAVVKKLKALGIPYRAKNPHA